MKYIVWAIIFSLLAGCQTTGVKGKYNRHAKQGRYQTTERDGAPSGPLPFFFREQKPKNEPLSRYGNPSTYKVDGHTYQVMTSAGGYHAKGLASWYGTKFHSKRTSSGEDYDMYALTAAHRTLPLPTYLRVKNLDNGRVAIVKVNDRGPFHSGRVIDLSYAAAVKLGLLPKGTAHVEIEALSVKGNRHPQVAHYYLQAGAFTNYTLAQNLKRKLSNITSFPIMVERYRQHYIVRVGPFATKQLADNMNRTLKRQGIKGVFSQLM